MPELESKDIGEIPINEWKKIEKEIRKKWKQLSKQKGKRFCSHKWGEPSTSVDIPPASIYGMTVYPNGVRKAQYRHFYSLTTCGIRQCEKCGALNVASNCLR